MIVSIVYLRVGKTNEPAGQYQLKAPVRQVRFVYVSIDAQSGQQWCPPWAQIVSSGRIKRIVTINYSGEQLSREVTYRIPYRHEAYGNYRKEYQKYVVGMHANGIGIHNKGAARLAQRHYAVFLLQPAQE